MAAIACRKQHIRAYPLYQPAQPDCGRPEAEPSGRQAGYVECSVSRVAGEQALVVARDQRDLMLLGEPRREGERVPNDPACAKVMDEDQDPAGPWSGLRERFLDCQISKACSWRRPGRPCWVGSSRQNKRQDRRSHRRGWRRR
jgi:hypothetical protein